MKTDRLTRLESALGSLKARITMGGIMALVLGIGLITTILVGRTEHDLLESQRQREMSESVRTAALLGHNVLQLQRVLESVTAMLDEPTLRNPAALKEFMQSKPVMRNFFANIYLASPDGQVRIMVDEKGLSWPALNIGDRRYFGLTLAEGRPMVSAALRGSLTGEPIIAFTQPVRNAGGVYAVLGGTLRLSSRDLLDGLVDTQSGDAGVLTIVTDTQGRVLAHPDSRKLLHSISDEPRLAQAFKAWLASGSPVEPQGLLLPQAHEIVSAAGVPGPDWIVWRERSEAEVLAPVKAAREQATIWAGSLVAVLSVGLFLTLWWLLQPLTLLERRAQHMFDAGMKPEDGWPDADGEIGNLGKVLRQVGIQRAGLEQLNSEMISKLRSVMRAAPIGIAFVRDRRFELVSDELCRTLAYSTDQLLGQPVDMIVVPPEDGQPDLATLEKEAFATGNSYVGECRMRRGDASRFWARLRSRPVDPAHTDFGSIWTLVNIEEQRSARRALEWSAAHDGLTGLANRQRFDQQAQRLIAARPDSLPAALVFIDLDHFKAVNDTAGHISGDAMLRAAAAAIMSRVRSGDLAARIGGDEFALLLERCSHEAAVGVAEDIVASISAIALPWLSGSLQIGASIGVASLTPEIDTVNAWVDAADAACYAAKAAGRGVVRVGRAPGTPDSTPGQGQS
ncbi:diguanylate cyclase [Variovorax sp. PAMC26660]|uniref:sensor domain-containing diguanylate cyclase n=1 Tax=Variovorax sp. PAMC26660 TaxID=2762322 RepID=UPI00164D7D28|nr:diguanylate cyclase [Variovorax sp. PAMC26660]QNK67418.1 diguanylate cyclase [Variovorax sp. PAMC26660]